ncbi:MAG: DnaB-like helicase C-terminal domain-containing protein [Bacteroidales bacterium]|nr:DnaB-like helicase C-terminal domain-containing protein [Bacteroidales bacterium]
MPTDKVKEMEGPIHVKEAINRALELVEKGQNLIFGIPSGYPDLDRLTRGWDEGDLVIIGGRPASCKTALALGMARNAAVEFAIPTAYFSLVMSSVELTNRLIISESGVSNKKLCGSERMSEQEWFEMESSLIPLSTAPLFFDDTPCIRPKDLRERIGELVEKLHLKLIFVDYLQLMLPDGEVPRSGRTHDDEVEENLRSLKEIARSFEVTIIVLSPVRRPPQNKFRRPVYSDLEYCCPSAGQYCDRILLLHRPKLLDFDPDCESTERLDVELIHNKKGPVGVVNLIFDKERYRMVNPSLSDR